MKIAVVAANGRSGQAFVEEALSRGHTIRAGIFHSNNLAPHQNLTIVPCDATSTKDLTNLITGQDAVVSFIGHVKGSPADVQTNAMRALVSVMKQHSLQRIVSLTGTGVRFPGDKVGLVDWILNTGVNFVDPQRIQDGQEHVKVLQASHLDWTVIRVLKLQNVSPKPYRLTEHGPTKWYVGRKEVAQAVLEVLEKESFIQAAPIISRPQYPQTGVNLLNC